MQSTEHWLWHGQMWRMLWSCSRTKNKWRLFWRKCHGECHVSSVGICRLLQLLNFSSENFINLFCDKLANLANNMFHCKAVVHFLIKKQENFKESEFVVNLDSSENYTIFIQDEVQHYHWERACENTPFYYNVKLNTSVLL